MTFPTAAYKHSSSSYFEATEEVPENRNTIESGECLQSMLSLKHWFIDYIPWVTNSTLPKAQQWERAVLYRQKKNRTCESELYKIKPVRAVTL